MNFRMFPYLSTSGFRQKKQPARPRAVPEKRETRDIAIGRDKVRGVAPATHCWEPRRYPETLKIGG